MQEVLFKDLGQAEYKQVWDYQESLLQENVRIKTEARRLSDASVPAGGGPDEGVPAGASDAGGLAQTTNYLLFVEHLPVYTLGKSGHMENLLINERSMQERGIQFFRINRGGDITYHGPGQIVGYPILDLERFYTDIGKYLRNLEEVIILTLRAYGIQGDRSPGETGVWIEPGVKGRERKICAIGVRCSRWITMHGFAFNVNTDMSYFGNIIPCGIQDKQVTSLAAELGHPVPIEEVKAEVRRRFEEVFGVELKTLSE
jgi:lipoyl(octanoyl) transferase